LILNLLAISISYEFFFSYSYYFTVTADDLANSISPFPRRKRHILGCRLIIEGRQIITLFPGSQGSIPPIPIVPGVIILPSMAAPAFCALERPISRTES
jgi:hypothetical protein